MGSVMLVTPTTPPSIQNSSEAQHVSSSTPISSPSRSSSQAATSKRTHSLFDQTPLMELKRKKHSQSRNCGPTSQRPMNKHKKLISSSRQRLLECYKGMDGAIVLAATSVTGVLRYRVELAVSDGADDATFVVFDSEMTKLTSRPASSLRLELKVTPFNFTPNHRSFTVTKLTAVPTSEETSEGLTNNDGNPPSPDSAAGKTGGKGIAMNDKPQNTGEAGVECSRKRGAADP
ncbi:unnamed protein product [Microthlaspi erraticum]|uniref:Replication factor A C-terminal domain-containing protein n=1 Tax=Microthlaspi erraticum TaxID=1685480 RepID=A0A6D2HMX3_9BRAS|nr:unnamed protein product [Microthlaspi erraticum]